MSPKLRKVLFHAGICALCLGGAIIYHYSLLVQVLVFLAGLALAVYASNSANAVTCVSGPSALVS